ncbi:MAG: DUF1566 domain-containing protein [Nitrosopumilus sp.]|nr:DUF1566 domain-containing protein [Nitrosopumilus sp.]
MLKKTCCASFLLLFLSACNNETPQDTTPKPVNNEFNRINTDGTPYTGSGNYSSDPWYCVYDKRTKLIWEVKTGTDDIHNKYHTYTWFNQDLAKNNKQPGIADGGKCTGSKCDTYSYVNTVNEKGLCGFKDWRLPKRVELGTIVNRAFSKTGTTINPEFFPNTHPKEYWTDESYTYHYVGAWAWDFSFGYDRVDWKKEPKYIRLVRSDPEPTEPDKP